MWFHWNDWRILPNIFQTVFQQRLLVQGTVKTSSRFILAISSSDFQYLTAGWTIKQGVVGKLRIKLWWVTATGNICLSHQCEGRAVTLFIFSNFICKHVIFHWIRGGQLNGCSGKLLSSWSLALMEWGWAHIPSRAVPPARFSDSCFDSQPVGRQVGV